MFILIDFTSLYIIDIYVASYWKNISIKKISEESGYGTATVDRVLNDRPGVSQKSKNKVLKILSNLQKGIKKDNKKRILICCESGPSYNRTLETIIDNVNLKNEYQYNLSKKIIAAKDFKTENFVKLIDNSEQFDALLIISQENHSINNSISLLAKKNKPSITLTTDLSNSNRTCYVGNDQSVAGSTAAHLIGKHQGKKNGSILMVMSMPYRCQQERELGFRNVIRSKYPNLRIKESIFSLDTSEESYKNVKKFIKENGVPLAVYNISGGNLGVAKAIDELNLKEHIIFIGHELNINSKYLLENDKMDYVIGHDVELEVTVAFDKINSYFNNTLDKDFYYSDVLIYNKYNCLNKRVF